LENWAAMAQNETGKYCLNCSKNVVDFTNLSDQETIEIITQSTTKICGRLNSSQLNRLMILNQGYIHHSRFYNFFAGLLLIGTSNNVKALDQKNQIETASHIDAQKKTQNGFISNDKIFQTDDPVKNTIKGKVIDSETKEVIEFASIVIKGTKTGCSSDINGNFKLVIPDSLLTEKINIIASYIGYDPIEFIINKTDLPMTKDLVFSFKGQVMNGAIEIVVKKKWWQRKNK
jgi:hypothetical protein